MSDQRAQFRRPGGATALVSAAATLVAAGSAMAFVDPDDPRERVFASSHGKRVRASIGSVNMRQPNGGCVHSDVRRPLKLEGRVPVHPGGRVTIDPVAKAKAASGSLSDVQSRRLVRVPVTILDPDGGRWRAKLPSPLPRNVDRLSLFIQYPDGSNGVFEAGLRRHRHKGRQAGRVHAGPSFCGPMES